MKALITSLFFLLSGSGLFAQPPVELPHKTDTLYYNKNWEITWPSYHSYYRVGTFDINDLYFIGDYTDYYANGNILEKGSYNTSGKKEGYFERYFKDGNYYSKGYYEDNQAVGIWTFYYESGRLKERVLFSESDYSIVEYHGPLGKRKLSKGSGKWERQLVVTGIKSPVLKAKFVDGQKEGEWQVKDITGKIFMRETYNQGQFRIGLIAFDEKIEKYNVPLISKESFLPSNHAIIESFQFFRQTNQSHYPYFKNLPSAPNQVGDKDGYRSVGDIQVRAKPAGGMSVFYQQLYKEIVYPEEARSNGVEGTVYVELIVKEDGSLSDPKIVKGLGHGCDEQVLMILQRMNAWTPASSAEGSPVAMEIRIPIVFSPDYMRSVNGSFKNDDIGVNDDPVFTIAQVPASPNGGMEAFRKYISDNMIYPEQARKQGITGRVYVQFIVEKDGFISNAQVVKGLGYGCDEEAIWLIQQSPRWNSAKQRGVTVRQKMVLPIDFSK